MQLDTLQLALLTGCLLADSLGEYKKAWKFCVWDVFTIMMKLLDKILPLILRLSMEHHDAPPHNWFCFELS